MKKKPKKILTKNDIERDAFISSVMVGLCPNCGSNNTHDCSKEEYVAGPETAISEQRVAEVEVAKDVVRIGSDCPTAMRLDDLTIGHCDDCSYLWCLECGSELSIDKPMCGHWEICEDCGKTDEFPDFCHFKAEAEAGELVVNPCLLDCPNIHECSKCPYDFEIENCPKIKTWKSNKNKY